jgi:hypothetical protein
LALFDEDKKAKGYTNANVDELSRHIGKKFLGFLRSMAGPFAKCQFLFVVNALSRSYTLSRETRKASELC